MAVRFPKEVIIGFWRGTQYMSSEDDYVEQPDTFVADGVEYNVGEIIPKRVTPNGTYTNEEVVRVFCQVCGAEFVGPIREAGGFLGGHECYHRWEMLLATMPDA